MGEHVFLKVLGLSIIAVAVALWMPGGQPPEEYKNLPWQIEVTGDGHSTVFGITLGKSTLGEVEQQLQEQSQISLFATDDGERVVEAYFNTVNISGFRAKMVATLGFDEKQLQELYDRGERISTLAMGKRKVTLSGADLAKARDTVVVTLTYLPRTNLDEATVIKRFGEPAEKIMEADKNTEHWLYPDVGLDVVMSAEDREVLQYVAPNAFNLLRQPLEKMSHADAGQSPP